MKRKVEEEAPGGGGGGGGVKQKIWQRSELGALNLAVEAVWIFDFENGFIWWANETSVRLFQAESVEELRKRDFGSARNDSVVVKWSVADFREKQIVAGGERGVEAAREAVHEDWTFYPKGEAVVTVRLTNTAIYIEDGRLAMLCQGPAMPKSEIDNAMLRGMELFRHLPICVEQLSREGAIMQQNPAAEETFGAVGGALAERFVDVGAGQAFWTELRESDRGSCCTAEAQLRTKSGDVRWFLIDGRAKVDPCSGDVVLLTSTSDVTARKMAELELKNAKEAAELATRKRSEFFAVISHEFRTPLNGVIGFAELLREDGAELSAAHRDYLATIWASAKAMMILVNDFLDLAKLEAGKMTFERAALDASAAVRSAVEVIRPAADAKGLTIRAYNHVDDNILGDPNRVRQILLNFLSNAVKFTPEGGSITVVAARREENVRFECRDTGIGIAKEDQPKLFANFAQVDVSVARKYGGTGLGLAVCREIAKALGGSVGVESDESRGSTFWFDLPFRKFEGSLHEVDSKPLLSPQKRLRVLVAEDNATNQKLVAAILSKLGHEPVVVANGSLAVEALQASTFDFAFLDRQMPVLGGEDAARAIRQLGFTLPIIGLTADYAHDAKQHFINCGMNDCFAKPFRIAQIRDAIAKYGPS
ncbi:hypothetical protein CTAYLR_000632 [Chrysophaeum taylorii]|uniref:Histidine kinase n=1 Tax=Chrysophaeum taylorii TaxID=2483200 RepID=A0AAD7XJB3_9STRA|nr:hypothetical protein CTAYLR_000632 [Chrysophaeum taylorii]